MVFQSLKSRKSLIPLLFLLSKIVFLAGAESFQINHLKERDLERPHFQNFITFPPIRTLDEESETCQVFRKPSKFQKSNYEREFSIWDEGYIPYVLHRKLDTHERDMIGRAMTQLQNQTCIRFIPKSLHSDYVLFKKGRGACGSFVGKTGGKQSVNLNKSCMKEGNILHELLHVVGFEHEQCREDRDEHIRISFYNITQRAKHNFFKVSPPRLNYAGPYDITSITHYGPFAFGKNDHLQTIFPNRIEMENGASMGQRKGLSEWDILKVNKYYNCTIPEAHTTETFQYPPNPPSGGGWSLHDFIKTSKELASHRM